MPVTQKQMSDQILVTGAAGFVGRRLVRRLAADGHDVTALDIRRERPPEFTGTVADDVTYFSGSVLNEPFVETEVFPSPNTYDRVFHLAAIVGVDRYINPEDPLYIADVNINGTKYMLESVRGSDTRFVYTSTSEIYGRNPELPWNEQDDRVIGAPSKSRWAYSTMKGTCEHMIHMLGETDPGLSASIVRPFNLYGPGQRKEFVISKFMRQVMDGDPPTVYDDGTQQRCFTYIDDFIDGIVSASEHEHDTTEVYNLGSTEEVEIRELANTILDIAGVNASPEFVDRGSEHGDTFEEPNRRVPDISHADDQLDWQPSTPLREGLERTYQWLRDQE
jgi:UDP-glucose 4-epimerase